MTDKAPLTKGRDHSHIVFLVGRCLGSVLMNALVFTAHYWIKTCDSVRLYYS